MNTNKTAESDNIIYNYNKNIKNNVYNNNNNSLDNIHNIETINSCYINNIGYNINKNERILTADWLKQKSAKASRIVSAKLFKSRQASVNPLIEISSCQNDNDNNNNNINNYNNKSHTINNNCINNERNNIFLKKNNNDKNNKNYINFTKRENKLKKTKIDKKINQVETNKTNNTNKDDKKICGNNKKESRCFLWPLTPSSSNLKLQRESRNYFEKINQSAAFNHSFYSSQMRRKSSAIIDETLKKVFIPPNIEMEARKIAEEAMKENKVFAIEGSFDVVREVLRKKGWVEQIYPKDVYKQPKSFEEAIVHIMSQVVKNAAPRLIFIHSNSAFDKLYCHDNQFINRFDSADSFTTKSGLTHSLKSCVWFSSIGEDSFYPRSYNLSKSEEMEEFVGCWGKKGKDRIKICLKVN